jgi:hypothetical protein
MDGSKNPNRKLHKAMPKLEPRILNPNTIDGMSLECNELGLKLRSADLDNPGTNSLKPSAARWSSGLRARKIIMNHIQ